MGQEAEAVGQEGEGWGITKAEGWGKKQRGGARSRGVGEGEHSLHTRKTKESDWLT